MTSSLPADKLKRLTDLVLGLALSVALCPLLLTIGLAVKVTSHGPALFRQKRIGRNGQPFEALKFRTMHTNAEARLAELLASDDALRQEYETYHKLKHDPRVTSLGWWLRRHGLDELPQLWNVLRGEMSLVGPRPYLPRELEKLGEAADTILQVRPGMTGVWQVSGRNRVPFERRVELEASYVENWSWWKDLQILCRTVGVVAAGREA